MVAKLHKLIEKTKYPAIFLLYDKIEKTFFISSLSIVFLYFLNLDVMPTHRHPYYLQKHH